MLQQAFLHRAGRRHHIGMNIRTSAASTQAAPMRQGKAEASIPMRAINAFLCERGQGQPSALMEAERLPVMNKLGR